MIFQNIFNEKETHDIIDLYLKNTPIDEIIETYHTTEHYIRIILKQNQIDRKYNSFSDELYLRIYKLYQMKYTQKEISEALLVSDIGVGRILKKHGIKKRTYSECNRRYNRNQHYFDEINTSNKAYILGLLYADGCNATGHNTISISLQEQDKGLLEYVRTELSYEGQLHFIPLKNRNPKYQNQYRLCINDEYMSKRLEELGLVCNKSLQLEYPTFIPMKLMRHFIRGYFDGDGSIGFNLTENRAHLSIVGTSSMMNGILNILKSMNCGGSIYHPKQSGENNTYCLQLCGNKSVMNFMDWIYDGAELFLERKHEKYLEIKERLGME